MAGNTTQRGYGHQHQQNRARLLRQLQDGSACPVCGRGLYKTPARNFDGAPLEADHHKHPLKYAGNKRAAMADRLIHRTCNRAGGAWDTPARPVVHEDAQRTKPTFNWSGVRWE